MQSVKISLLGLLTICSISVYAASNNAAQLDFTSPPPDGALTSDQTPPLWMPTSPPPAPSTTTTTTTTNNNAGPGTPTPSH